ncbi:hypothetical protein J4E91_001880 [Alternaria rosae]|nr:hypothetical protein J4E91_001880 [Alternaria rosae]
MTRRSTAFVTKRPHRKSRGGCLTCKKKKVKCDETQPICGYCNLRKLDCEYIQDTPSTSRTSSAGSLSRDEAQPSTSNSPVDFNDLSIQLVPYLNPHCHTSIGTLTALDNYLLQYYRTDAYRTVVSCDDAIIQNLHKETIPQLSVSNPFLLYALLGMTATYSNNITPNKTVEKQALLYRQKTFSTYKEALKNITAENYEAVLVTGGLLLALVPAPTTDTDEDYLEWVLGLLKLSEGLRILASLRWAQGIEKLSVYPLVRREIKTLPPPPIIDVAGIEAPIGPLGTTPDNPNPAPTYTPIHFPTQTRLFLPPLLMQLLQSVIRGKESGTLDWHRPTLLPVFHALSPIFLSLYYYRLDSDFYVRIFVWTSFLMPDYLQLLRDKEPRALVLFGWWLALANLAPKGWWTGKRVRKTIGALGRAIQAQPVGDGGFAGRVLNSALRIVDVMETEGREAAAKAVFDDWPGVLWEEGPVRAQAWEYGQLVDLGELGELDGGLDMDAAVGIDLQELGISV